MADESNTTSEASAEGGVHRLRDILVEEVSLVDRAANKRRFLVIKRSDAMPGNGKRPGPRKADERDNASARRGSKPKPDEVANKARRRARSADDEEAEKARRRPPGAKDEEDKEDDDVDTDKADDDDEEDDEEDEDVDTDKADDDEDDDEDEDEDVDTDKADDDDDEGDDDVDTDKADDDDDEEDEDDDEDDEDEEGDAVPTGRRGKAKKAGDPRDLGLSPAVKSAVLPVITTALERLLKVAQHVNDHPNASVRSDVAGELAQIGELLDHVTDRLPTGMAPAKAGLAKAGARMARSRLDRFQKALATLSELLKELSVAKKPPTPTAAGRSTRQKSTGTPGLGVLVASVTELTKAVQRQQEELSGLRKTRATSNAIPIDGSRRAERNEVSWPLDMNRPITRDTVGKSISFYDD